MLLKSVYLHIPFCHEICHYCDFTKIYYQESLADSYIEALEKEISMYVDSRKKVRTIYIGGGTPTSLSDRQFEAMLKAVARHFDIRDDVEFTIEANPGDFSKEKMNMLRLYGVNRISLGVQVLDDQFLKALNRSHQVKDVYETVDLLHQNGMENLSMDFIYALPGQTFSLFKETLKEAISFGLPHYSSYSLQIEPQTVFYIRYRQGKLTKPDEGIEANMYLHLIEEMNRHGILQYEISNFARPGFESRHNLTYWNNDYYYGFGAGAHSYFPGRRVVNIRPVNHYIKSIETGRKPVLHEEKITLKERIEEEMFLGLRKTEGVSRKKFFKQYHQTIDELYGERLNDLKEKNWLMDDGDVIRLTTRGMLFGNDVFQAFLLDGDPFGE
ncbi:radical SAM family heme chaperone HemW [Melghiribacillus thermohalophilus]|uniref:radical SAM family heme chaperone HemW n=1 Tax=Melghiribacillus thermohalophilus TaxID=1324956 RepID=UPI00104E1372|nr:radical SAM family heme chaperone HemW [Melghiribacillus thermohalophilus]